MLSQRTLLPVSTPPISPHVLPEDLQLLVGPRLSGVSASTLRQVLSDPLVASAMDIFSAKIIGITPVPLEENTKAKRVEPEHHGAEIAQLFFDLPSEKSP